jgi:carbamate kinase
MRIVVALGGNALLRRGERPDSAIQLRHLDEVAPALAALAAKHEVVIVHGNGPQVGLLAGESADNSSLSAPYPLSDMVAETQGLIGFWIQQALGKAGLKRDVIALISRTVVDAHDPAMAHPTKFIGPEMKKAAAERLRLKHGWTFSADGQHWRRVVPSPAPIRVLEGRRASKLLEGGATVVLGGGGGVAVTITASKLTAVDAVVDKDLVAAKIAIELGAELLVILTDVEGVLSDFGSTAESLIQSTSPTGLSSLVFAPGSMGPKVKAVSEFTRVTGNRSAIGSLDQLTAIVAGIAGTQVLRSVAPSARAS